MGYKTPGKNLSDGCLQCGRVLYGRPDKKFCDDSCRNHYYSHLRAESRHSHRVVTAQLNTNYGILEGLLKEGRNSASLRELVIMGFSPAHMTGQSVNGKGYAEYHCFDIAYRQSFSKVFDLRTEKGKD